MKAHYAEHYPCKEKMLSDLALFLGDLSQSENISEIKPPLRFCCRRNLLGEHNIVLTLSFKETLCINCKIFLNIQVKTPVGQITHNGVNGSGFLCFLELF